MTPEEASVMKALLPINGKDECSMCWEETPPKDFIHIDTDNKWGGDQDCLWHPIYDDARKLLGIVKPEPPAPPKPIEPEHEIDLKRFKEEMTRLQGCCMRHPEDYQVDQIVYVAHWVPSVPDEETGYALFLLKDGRWGTMDESQDFTGHGCQCISHVAFFDTKKDAIRLGLGKDGCSMLEIAMPS